MTAASWRCLTLDMHMLISSPITDVAQDADTRPHIIIKRRLRNISGKACAGLRSPRMGRLRPYLQGKPCPLLLTAAQALQSISLDTSTLEPQCGLLDMVVTPHAITLGLLQRGRRGYMASGRQTAYLRRCRECEKKPWSCQRCRSVSSRNMRIDGPPRQVGLLIQAYGHELHASPFLFSRSPLSVDHRPSLLVRMLGFQQYQLPPSSVHHSDPCVSRM